MELIWWLKAELEKTSGGLENIRESQYRKSFDKDESVYGCFGQISVELKEESIL